MLSSIFQLYYPQVLQIKRRYKTLNLRYMCECVMQHFTTVLTTRSVNQSTMRKDRFATLTNCCVMQYSAVVLTNYIDNWPIMRVRQLVARIWRVHSPIESADILCWSMWLVSAAWCSHACALAQCTSASAHIRTHVHRNTLWEWHYSGWKQVAFSVFPALLHEPG